MCIICRKETLDKLQRLDCSHCPLLTTIPEIQGLQSLDCTGCKWIKKNPGFNQSIIKLKLLQSWFKKLLLSKRLKRLIPKLIPIYYHPEAKGDT